MGLKHRFCIRITGIRCCCVVINTKGMRIGFSPLFQSSLLLLFIQGSLLNAGSNFAEFSARSDIVSTRR